MYLLITSPNGTSFSSALQWLALFHLLYLKIYVLIRDLKMKNAGQPVTVAKRFVQSINSIFPRILILCATVSWTVTGAF